MGDFWEEVWDSSSLKSFNTFGSCDLCGCDIQTGPSAHVTKDSVDLDQDRDRIWYYFLFTWIVVLRQYPIVHLAFELQSIPISTCQDAASQIALLNGSGAKTMNDIRAE